MKIILLITLFCFLHLCPAFSDEPKIKYGQSSYVKIHSKNLTESLNAYTKHWAFLPPENITTQSKKLTGSVLFAPEVYFPREAKLYIDSLSSISFYLIPEDTIEIFIDFNFKNDPLKAVVFSGKNASISQYIFERDESFQYRHGLEGAKLRSAKIPLSQYLTKMDSLQNIELTFLNEFNLEHPLPEWFFKTEKWSIIYGKAERKAMVPNYRKDMLKRNEPVPDNYYSFWQEIHLLNLEAKFSYEYFFYIGSYFYHNLLDEKYMGKGKETLFNRELEIYPDLADSLLGPLLSDIFLCFEFGNMVLFGLTELYDSNIENFKTNFQNKEIFQILEEYRKNKYSIKAGDPAFNFYLPDESGKYYELTDFKDNIVLLNFWFPGCSPCIFEVPYERELVEEFSGKNFKLVNICLNNTPEQIWKTSIERYNLHGVNLLANKNWTKMLTRNFTVAGFPTYVLIGKDGKIIDPKAIRPSRGINKEIAKHL